MRPGRGARSRRFRADRSETVAAQHAVHQVVEVTIVGSLGGFRLDIPGAHLRVEEFEQFRTQLRPLSERLTGTASMHSLEGWIDLTVAGRGSGHLEISGGVNDCPGTGNEFRFTIPGYDQTFLPSLIDQLDGIVASFSIVNTTD